MRPEWASGAEWEGWKDDGQFFCLRKLDDQFEFTVHCHGTLTINQARRREILFPFPSLEVALSVANAIAEALGGWQGEES